MRKTKTKTRMALIYKTPRIAPSLNEGSRRNLRRCSWSWTRRDRLQAECVYLEHCAQCHVRNLLVWCCDGLWISMAVSDVYVRCMHLSVSFPL